MSKAKLLCWLFGVCLGIQVQAGVVYIDTADNPEPDFGWNVIDFTAYSTESLVDTNDTFSGIVMEINTTLTSVNRDGLIPSGAAAEFVPAGTNSVFGSIGAWNGIVSPVGEATFSGLATNRAYTFTFFASRGDASDNRDTLYTLTGSNSDSNNLDVANNTSGVVVVSNIYPNTDGTIELSVSPGPNNSNSSKYFYIGAIKIDYADGGSVSNEKLNILFFGNSFTINGSAPALVAKLAEIAGHTKPLAFGDLAGGTDLEYHISQVVNYPGNNVTNAVIGTNTWDYVVIQGYSTEATHIGNPVAFTNNALTLYQDVKYHPSGRGVGVKAIMFETWARNASHSFYPDTFTDPYAMQAEIRPNYHFAVDQINDAEVGNYARFAGVGDAFERGDFSDDFYASDLYHQGGIGTNLIAMVLYKTIYGGNVSDISYADAVNAGWTTMTATEWTNLTSYADSITIPDVDPTEPLAPSLTSPSDGANTVLQPTFQLSATDANDDDLNYRVEIAENSDFSGTVLVYDQSFSQTGWSGQNALTNTAYTSGTTAILTITNTLTADSTYYWRAAAKDVSGSDTWSTFSDTNSFTVTDTTASIYIDCGLADAPAASWNNVNFSTVTSANLIDHDGIESGINLAVTTRTQGVNTQGTSTPTGAAADLAPAGGYSAYGSTVEWQTELHPYCEATFSGLDANSLYTFTFFASRLGVSDNRETIYILSGENSDSNTLDAANNVSEVTVVSNIQASFTGTIDLKFEPGPANDNSYHFYYLASMRIDVLADGVFKPSVPVLYEPADFEACSSNPTFKMSSTDPDGDPLQYKIELSTNVNFATIDYTYDQTLSQTGWTNQNALTSTAYSSGSTGEFTVVTSLDDNIYYWRAYAYDFTDSESWSPVSQSRMFSVATSQYPPDAPTLLTPADGGSNSQIPEFTLSTIDSNLDNVQFKVEVSANADFTGTVYTYNQNELQAGWEDQDADSGTAYVSGSIAKLVTQRVLDAETTYYWRAFAIDADGSDTWSVSSATNSFLTTDSVPIYIDCSGNNAPSATWNNFSFTQSADTTASLHNTNGLSSGISIKVVSSCSGSTSSSIVASGAAAEFAPAGLGTAYRQSTDAVFNFSGLNGSAHVFTFFGSRSTSGNREVIYQVEGSTSGADYMNVSDNTDKLVVVSNIYSTAAGDVDLTIKLGTNNNSYVYINAMKIEYSVSPTGMPNAPTLISPIAGEKGGIHPIMTLSTTDAQGDYVVYKIEIATDAGFNSIAYTYDQSVSQTGWMNQDMHSGTAYASGSTATLHVSSTLQEFETYYWRAYAMDPAGSGEWSLVSDVQSFVSAKFGTMLLIK